MVSGFTDYKIGTPMCKGKKKDADATLSQSITNIKQNIKCTLCLFSTD